jgi:hypothetical protein
LDHVTNWILKMFHGEHLHANTYLLIGCRRRYWDWEIPESYVVAKEPAELHTKNCGGSTGRRSIGQFGL